jgi:hypothetical protein
MTHSLKRKIRLLMDAINDALSGSDEITRSLNRVRQEGYDLLLVLEATVVLNGSDEDEDGLDDHDDLDDDEEEEDDGWETIGGDEDYDDSDFEDESLDFRTRKPGKEFVARLTPQDIRFLSSLQISSD